ncbi:MAG: hypothetical protein COA96_05690 [SAR86 cluster bacterium]|uniref:dTTP/UTP pyrophosphatase n=1 Tax=SAR86 cluster bacterium TaxID=2030880 RepID=A0A2A5B3X0_9GAMM|nr:MAG: hypothetical protein COA96_05690 [SAR86 cluster bacterium]
MSPLKIILASASPRRQQLLEQLGVSFAVESQDIDETIASEESPIDYVQRMANGKAESALQKHAVSSQTLILAADTIVVCDKEVMGKPSDQKAAIEMLLTLSGREHHVLSAVTVATLSEKHFIISDSTVRFRTISPEEAKLYWLTGEPVGKAGGYGIQGRAAVFISHLEGSYSGVMGLPLFETAQLLERFGLGGLHQTAAKSEGVLNE